MELKAIDIHLVEDLKKIKKLNEEIDSKFISIDNNSDKFFLIKILDNLSAIDSSFNVYDASIKVDKSLNFNANINIDDINTIMKN